MLSIMTGGIIGPQMLIMVGGHVYFDRLDSELDYWYAGID